ASEPAALPTEGVFAASNSSLILCGPGHNELLFATGGPAARVFHSTDNAKTWSAVTTPILSGNPSAGIFSIACNGSAVVAVGGDYRNPANTKSVAAYSTNMGTTWQLSDKPPAGYRSSVVAVESKRVSTTWVAVGTTGTDISTDTGAHWVRLNRKNSNAVIATGSDLVLVVGPQSTLYELKVLKDLW
ncbi:MAG: exo-alpha-sialidase, partial [Acidobacteria bacterium]|nr:exo-alpha-sialidase [Acidobacteriota bacterium]